MTVWEKAEMAKKQPYTIGKIFFIYPNAFVRFLKTA